MHPSTVGSHLQETTHQQHRSKKTSTRAGVAPLLFSDSLAQNILAPLAYAAEPEEMDVDHPTPATADEFVTPRTISTPPHSPRVTDAPEAPDLTPDVPVPLMTFWPESDGCTVLLGDIADSGVTDIFQEVMQRNSPVGLSNAHVSGNGAEELCMVDELEGSGHDGIPGKCLFVCILVSVYVDISSVDRLTTETKQSSDTISESPVDSETYPWPSYSVHLLVRVRSILQLTNRCPDLQAFLTHLLFGSATLQFSEAQKRAILSWGKAMHAQDVPSMYSTKKVEDSILKLVGNPTEKVVSASGNVFYANQVHSAIAKVRSTLKF